MPTTTTGTRAASNFPAFTPNGSGLLCAAYGTATISANVTIGDIWKLCKLPAGAVVLGGAFWASDMDTGTETLDMDVGWADNGAEAADADGFCNSGVLSGDAITDFEAAGVNYRPFPLTSGPITFTRETVVQVQVNAAAATFASGTITVVVNYIVP